MLLKARDEGFGLSAAMLIYPMLDDRTIASPVSGPKLTGPFIIWSYDDNITGRRCLLGEVGPGDLGPGDLGPSEISSYAAPARATQLEGLPPIYIEVGDLDIFHDEDVAFASRLRDVGGDVQFHLRPGCLHVYEVVAPKSRIAQLAMQQRYEFLRAFN